MVQHLTIFRRLEKLLLHKILYSNTNNSTNHVSGNTSSRAKRAAAYSDTSFYWENGTVPFLFYPSFKESSARWYRHRAMEAMWQIEFHTCIRFVELSNGDGDHAILYNDPYQCSSKVINQLRSYYWAPDACQRYDIRHGVHNDPL